MISIVTPAYNESQNLPVLLDLLSKEMAAVGMDWEWIVVDDHSSDETQAVLGGLARREHRMRAFRLSRNSGSHKAIACGLEQARGQCAVVLAADLQDPPETIPCLLEKWKEGAQVVLATRAQREGEHLSTIGFSKLYWFMMRHLSGTSRMPANGADFFLLDRAAVDALTQFKESSLNICALISWMGFRQEEISYTKRERKHGKSGWTLWKKLKLVSDSVTAFTAFPLRAMSYTGFTVAFCGFIYAGLIMLHAFQGERPQGWASLMVAVVMLSGVQMGMLGVLGQYLWQALEESRRRPRYLIEWASDTDQKKLKIM
jgi:polyisoprenyl-phosphate glycosyltransferase